MTVFQRELHARFKSQIAAMPGGKLACRCFDCGTCAGICPVSRHFPVFDPRKILHMIRLGLKDRLLTSESIWYCSHCDTCRFACPQDIQFSSIVDVLRDMAVKEGYVDQKVTTIWGTAPCKAACPAHISIPGFISAIVNNRYVDGLKLIKEEMPFPGICGRVCPHPCEIQCNRNAIDAPVAIEALKRFLSDANRLAEIPYIPQKKKAREERVAVIGSGPAGLTVAAYLAVEGYPVTVFEKHPVPGGMMAVGIPEFRLPRDILETEIEMIRQLGVDIRLNVTVGTDCTFDELQADYRAIFIGTGCDRSIKLRIPGEGHLSGVFDGLSFLKRVNLADPPRSGKRMVIIGGGNTAIDCARVARRIGYDRVSIVYRRTREEMPANAWEVDEAIEEGIDIQLLTAPLKILAADGQVSSVECMRMALGDPDESGRRRPVPIKGSEFVLKAEAVVAAVGQIPDLSCLAGKDGFDISKQGLIVVDPETGMTNIPGVFAGGDVVSGPKTIVEAVALGKTAAKSMNRYLKGRKIKASRRKEWRGIKGSFDDDGFIGRESMPMLSLPERKQTFKEVELGFNEDQAKREAGRCLRVCGFQKLS